LTTPLTFPLQFHYIPYPLWRKYVLPPLRPLAERFYSRIYPVDTDRQPPRNHSEMVRYLIRWGLVSITEVHRLSHMLPQFTPRQRDQARAAAPDAKIRLPAPWERLEAVLLNFPVMYPPLWALYAEMAEAIAAVAQVQITIPGAGWAGGIALYLHLRGKIDLAQVRFLDLAADDIWVRDYGPLVGYSPDGTRGVVSAKYATHAVYPQARDDAMAGHFAAFHDLPLRDIPITTEGGNFLTDGAGTLLMTDGVLRSNPHLTRDSLETLLHAYFDFEKLILTPRLTFETTGHVDMLVKLIDPQTLLISAPNTLTARGRLQATIDLFRRETNARGQHYHIELVPTLGLYYNWLVYPIRRSYTNSLTVNGRILVPTYRVQEDAEALAIYRRLAPDYEIMPIDCALGANGGGAVHCMTKEVPAPL
jgi:agmatine deiminase